jgi:DNA (cytosine-5)-methyltransferase 1
MTHGSLFSGIGGFDLAAEWMGWTNVFHCEMNPFGQRVLAHHFPNSKLHEDVTTFPSADYAGRIDILSGGFPCQPYSVAGKRQGKDDERHLWPAMLDVIRAVRPKWVVGENVRGLVSWNGGLVFEEVCADLEDSGYAVQPYLLPAGGVGAPHRRDRIWFVAYREDVGPSQAKEVGRERGEPKSNDRNQIRGSSDANGESRSPADAKRLRLEHGPQSGSLSESEGEARKRVAGHVAAEGWSRFPTQPPVCGGDDGLPSELDGITFPKWRAESIKAYGNAIVPQVALQIFKAIQAYEHGAHPQEQ